MAWIYAVEMKNCPYGKVEKMREAFEMIFYAGIAIDVLFRCANYAIAKPSYYVRAHQLIRA